MVLHALLILGIAAFAIFVLVKVVVFLAEFLIFFAKFLLAVVVIGFVIQLLYWIGISPISPLALIF